MENAAAAALRGTVKAAAQTSVKAAVAGLMPAIAAFLTGVRYQKSEVPFIFSGYSSR